MQQKRLNEIKATILFALGILILASIVSFTPDDLGFYTSHPNIPPHNLIRGFGAYLAGFLLKKGYEVHGIKRRSSSFNTGRDLIS